MVTGSVAGQIFHQAATSLFACVQFVEGQVVDGIHHTLEIFKPCTKYWNRTRATTYS